MSAEQYPLSWPKGRKRSPYRSQSKFKIGDRTKVVRFLFEQLRMAKSKNQVVSTNLKPRLDGEFSTREAIGDPGVAIYFTRNGKELCMAVDRYYTVYENLYAAGKCIEAIRSIERWGGEALVEQTFGGFAALPAPESQEKPWWEIFSGFLGTKVDPEWPLIALEPIYKVLAKKVHPDAGGTAQAMQQLNHAWEQAKEAKGKVVR